MEPAGERRKLAQLFRHFSRGRGRSLRRHRRRPRVQSRPALASLDRPPPGPEPRLGAGSVTSWTSLSVHRASLAPARVGPAAQPAERPAYDRVGRLLRICHEGTVRIGFPSSVWPQFFFVVLLSKTCTLPFLPEADVSAKSRTFVERPVPFFGRAVFSSKNVIGAPFRHPNTRSSAICLRACLEGTVARFWTVPVVFCPM